MISDYTKAVGQLQELFQKLADEGKISPEQAEQFDNSQKVLVNFHSWIQNQLAGNIKVDLPFPDEQFAEKWKLWKDFKKQQHGFVYKAIGEEAALMKLYGIAEGNAGTAIRIIQQSIDHGWAGFYPVKDEPKRQPKFQPKQKTESYDPDFN
ncbi:MAG: hypothetical protein ACK5JD_06240 [Mangrovibacterium sp.]